MHDDLPPPPVPADCDLRGIDYMPMHGHRLFGSAVYSMMLENPRAGVAAMKLWWCAWQQCPASSLPNDDRVLARLADFGTDLRAWRRAKDVAIHGFILCSDGRLYHPLLAELAVTAWSERANARDRKRRQRAAMVASDDPVDPDSEAADRHRAAAAPPPRRQRAAAAPSGGVMEAGDPHGFESDNQLNFGDFASDVTGDVTGTSPICPGTSYSYRYSKEDSVLRTAAADTHAKPEPALHREGLAVLMRLTGGGDRKCRKFIGALLRDMGGRGHEAQLLCLILDADRDPPVDVCSWLRRCALNEAKRQAGDCGITKFIAALPDKEDQPNAEHPDWGRWRLMGWHVEHVAQLVAEAARLPDGWAGRWDALAEWLREGLEPHGQILPPIRRIAGRADYEPPASMKFFDAAVRGARRAA
jgi:hypothetical protein